MIITALGEGEVGSEGQVWTNFNLPWVSWGYNSVRACMEMEKVLQSARGPDLRSFAQNESSFVHTSDPMERHQALFDGALKYYRSLGAPDCMTNPDTVLHLLMDLRTINLIRAEGKWPPLPLGSEHLLSTPDASLTAASSTGATTDFDDQIAATEQLDILRAPLLEGMLRAQGGWPLVPFESTEQQEQGNGSVPQAGESQTREDPYENTSWQVWIVLLGTGQQMMMSPRLANQRWSRGCGYDFGS